MGGDGARGGKDTFSEAIGDHLPPLNNRSVTANIGWYVVSILHDQPSRNIDIT